MIMPVYEYRCKFCGSNFEKYAQIAGDIVPECPTCGSSSVERDYSRQLVAVQPDIEPYYNFSLGEHVGSRRELREKLAYNNAWSPDMPRGNPTDGVLTKEERFELEGKDVPQHQGSVLDKRRRGEVRVDHEIDVEGEANYDEIKTKLRERHERRGGNG